MASVSTSSLIQFTNIVLTVIGMGTENRRFIIYNGGEVLNDIEVVRVSLQDNAKLFEHPLETGAVITDHEIFDPCRVTIQAYIAVDDTSSLQTLTNYYQQGQILKIKAGNKIIENAVVASLPLELSGEVYDKILYSISFKEVQRVTATYVALSSALSSSDSSTVNSGVIQATASSKTSSWLNSLVNGD